MPVLDSLVEMFKGGSTQKQQMKSNESFVSGKERTEKTDNLADEKETHRTPSSSEKQQDVAKALFDNKLAESVENDATVADLQTMTPGCCCCCSGGILV